MNQPAGRCCERDLFFVHFRVKEGRENETQFCCVLMLCVTRDNVRRLGKTQSTIRPAFDGVIFPFSSFLVIRIDALRYVTDFVTCTRVTQKFSDDSNDFKTYDVVFVCTRL